MLWRARLLPLFLASAAAVAADGRIVKRCYLKPCTIRGDFDGDGKRDRAVLVEDGIGRRGIRIRTGTVRTIVIGAGNLLGNGGENFDWLDHWKLHRGPIGRGATGGAPPKAAGDALLLEHEHAASGIVYWDGSEFAWYQQGD